MSPTRVKMVACVTKVSRREITDVNVQDLTKEQTAKVQERKYRTGCSKLPNPI